ncbi:MAG: acetyl-CoA decarbonylase/synthase complex subunit gamma [Chloroflexi bacterium]|nr:acetyl-CoA decarbonylase/synthase complex subunit gamma [Chloroflexota bacterium]
MALTGVQIYKFLPKTNCKECGYPTCLAFAMKLASRSVELTACPYVSEGAKTALIAAARPPIRLVTIGTKEKKIEVGNEVVLFRHEKTFIHPSALVYRIKDTDSPDNISKTVKEVAYYLVERVGIKLGMSGIAIQNESKNAASFIKCIEQIKLITDLPLILMATDPTVMNAALEKFAVDKPLIYSATKENAAQMIDLAKKYKCPLAIYSANNSLDELAALSEQATKAGVEDLVLDPGPMGFKESMAILTQIRRLAIKKSFNLLGYPVITFPGCSTTTLEEEAMLAGQQIAKYASIIILDHFSPAMLYTLLTLRLNIYTDPQKPIQMSAGIYPINNPKDDSCLCVTTNFSLTYFSIAGELESSGFPAWLLVCNTEGLSVLTAWAAGKFDADKIAKTIKDQNAATKINHKSIIIPGGVAVLKGELEESLAGWNIMVGPREAMAIGGYLKQYWNQ